MPFHSHRTLRISAALLASVLLLGGCGSSDDSTSKPADLPDTPTTTAPRDVPDIFTLETIASRDTSVDGAAIIVSLNEVRRRGNLLMVTYSVTRPQGSTDTAFLASAFRKSGGLEFDFDGVSVVDAKNQKAYPTARDNAGNCLCSSFKIGSAPKLTNGQTAVFSAVTGAPPSDVSNVDVVINNAGIFSDVTVS